MSMTSDKLVSPDVPNMNSFTTDECPFQVVPMDDEQSAPVSSSDGARIEGLSREQSVSYADEEVCSEKGAPANRMLCDFAMKGLSLGYDLSVVSTVLRTINPMHDSVSKFVELLIQCDKRQKQMTDQRKRLTRQYRSTLTNSHRHPFQFILDGMDIMTTFRDCNNESCLTMKGLLSAYKMLEPLNFGTSVVVISGNLWDILKTQRDAEDQTFLELLQAQDRLIVATGDSLTSRHWILELIPSIASRRSIIFANGASRLSLFNFRTYIMNLCKYPSRVDFATFHFKRNRFIIDDISCLSYDDRISSPSDSVSNDSLPLPPASAREGTESPHKSSGPSLKSSTCPHYKRDSVRDGSVIATLCPYNLKCTYGNKCKYYHPERGPLKQMSLSEQISLKAAVEKTRFKESLRQNGSLKALVNQMADGGFVDRSIGRFHVVTSDFAEVAPEHVVLIPSRHPSADVTAGIGSQRPNPCLRSSTLFPADAPQHTRFLRGDHFLPPGPACCTLCHARSPQKPSVCHWSAPHPSERAHFQAALGHLTDPPVATPQPEHFEGRCDLPSNAAANAPLLRCNPGAADVGSLQFQRTLPS